MVLSSLYVRGVKSALLYEHHINRKWWCQYLKSFSCVLHVVLLWWGRLGWKMEDPQLLGLIISLGWQCIYTSEVKSLSRVRLSAAPWTVAYQSPQSMEFSRQEYWSGLPFPSPGDLPNPGIETSSPTLQADTLPSEPPGKPKSIKSYSKI